MSELTYGVVRVIRGRHKGKIGYYDDDADGRHAIVYFGTPFVSPYYLIRHTSLEACDEPWSPLDDWLTAYPGIAAQMGVGR